MVAKESQESSHSQKIHVLFAVVKINTSHVVSQGMPQSLHKYLDSHKL